MLVQVFRQICFQIRRLREEEAFGRRDDFVDEHFMRTGDRSQDALTLVESQISRREQTTTKAFVLRGVEAQQAIERGQRGWTTFVGFVQAWELFSFDLLEEETRRSVRGNRICLIRRLERVTDPRDEHRRRRRR